MQGTRIQRVTGGLFLFATACTIQAQELQPDPAWQQGTLNNGFRWQVLATPQRPTDRVEIRLLIDTGTLTESKAQSGYARFLPRLQLTQSGSLQPAAARTLWQQSINPVHPMPPVIVSYDFTLFTLSLPNNRSDLIKDAMVYLAGSYEKLSITPETIDASLQNQDMVTSYPANAQDNWWRYRLAGSTLLEHDPTNNPQPPVDAEALNAFYQKWYTPDAMTLIVVGNIDSRSVIEQINKTFGELKGKRETPAPMPILLPLNNEPVKLTIKDIHHDRLSLIWDTPWKPIRDAAALLRYWRADLAREALFWNVQQNLSKNPVKNVNISFECRVLYQRAQCGINIESTHGKLRTNLSNTGRELARIRKRGFSQEEFDALIMQKKMELQKLFATYAHTNTDILTSQRMRSLQNQVVDIAPEQYQMLRQDFLRSLTLSSLNQEIRQQLSQDITLVLQQADDETAVNMSVLQETWEKIMAPAKKANMTGISKNDISDIPHAH